MATADKELAILGRGWRFPPSFDKRVLGVAMTESGQEEIEQSLSVLFATRPGERVMLPAYGCDLRRFLFRAIDTSTVTEIKDSIAKAILNWEPRILVNGITVDGRNYLDGHLLVSVDYTIRATNTRTNRVFPLYLQEATNLPLAR